MRNQRQVLVLSLALLSSARASVQLDIPCRLQWDNNSGYCGETSIQQAALLFGTYVSQYRAREIIDPTQQQDVWVPENSSPIFDALRLTVDTWNSGSATPQYQSYLVWIKNHLQQGHPVVFDVFVQGESDPAYDHIMIATGFTSTDTTTYHAGDTLTFNDNYETTPYVRTFGSLFDTRAMAGNGATYEYCIPRDTDYGCAVTGVKDSSGQLLPIRLAVNRRDEPNVSQGASPVTMVATVTVQSLVSGNAYALLRYNDYHNVPTNNYLSSASSSSTVFTATSSTYSIIDRFSSDSVTIYRCVPYSLSRPAISAVDGANSMVRIQFPTVLNIRYAVDWTTNLLNGSGWIPLTNGIAGTGETRTITNAIGSAASRCYRVTEQP